MPAINDFKNDELIIHCKKHNVRELYLFGSAVTDDFKDDSDLDFLVRFNRTGFKGAFNQYMDFKEGLEKIFNRKIDLYSNKKFRNKIFQKEGERTKKLLYAA